VREKQRVVLEQVGALADFVAVHVALLTTTATDPRSSRNVTCRLKNLAIINDATLLAIRFPTPHELT